MLKAVINRLHLCIIAQILRNNWLKSTIFKIRHLTRENLDGVTFFGQTINELAGLAARD